MYSRRKFLKYSVAMGLGLLMPNIIFGATKGGKMSILEESFTLNNGVKIPKLGLGTWRIEDNIVENVVNEAFKIGYLHIDTAQAYGNERGIGEAVRKSGIARDKLFITSKIKAEYKDKKSAEDSINASLKTMGLDYLDLMLIHSPQPWNSFRKGDYFEQNVEVYSALEEAQKAGKICAIGVSNFLQKT